MNQKKKIDRLMNYIQNSQDFKVKKCNTACNELLYRRPMSVCEYYQAVNSFAYVCPRCSAAIEREHSKYCVCCGQALQWHGAVKHAKLKR